MLPWDTISSITPRSFIHRIDYAVVQSLENRGLVIYLFGGVNNDILLKDIWKFDLSTGLREEVIPAPTSKQHPTPRRGMAYTLYAESFLIIIGGEDSVGPKCDVWCFDIDQLEWYQLDPPEGPTPHPRVGGYCFVFHDCVYLYGGQTSLLPVAPLDSDDADIANEILLRFNLVTFQWEEVEFGYSKYTHNDTTPPTARGSMSVQEEAWDETGEATAMYAVVYSGVELNAGLYPYVTVISLADEAETLAGTGTGVEEAEVGLDAGAEAGAPAGENKVRINIRHVHTPYPLEQAAIVFIDMPISIVKDDKPAIVDLDGLIVLGGVSYYGEEENKRYNQDMILVDDLFYFPPADDDTAPDPVVYFDYIASETRKHAPPRRNHRSVTAKGQLWIFGGWGGKEVGHLSTIETMENAKQYYLNDLYYSVSKPDDFTVDFIEENITGTNKPHGRELFAMEEWCGNLIVYGGKGASGVLNDVWRYNIGVHRWHRLYPVSSQTEDTDSDTTPGAGKGADGLDTIAADDAMVEGPLRHSCGSVVCNDTLYVYGGVDSHGNLSNELWGYGILTRRWVRLYGENTPDYHGKQREDPRMIVIDNQIVVIGGIGNRGQIINSIEIFDTSWHTVDNWQTELSSGQVVSSCPITYLSPAARRERGFYSFAGLNNSRPTTDTYLVDLSDPYHPTAAWEDTLRECTAGASMSAVNGVYLTFGGFTTFPLYPVYTDVLNRLEISFVLQKDDSAFECTPGSYRNPDFTFSSNIVFTSPTSICLRCPQGQYMDEFGKEECKLCPKGTYLNREGSSSSDECLLCPAGKYNAEVGQAECLHNLTSEKFAPIGSASGIYIQSFSDKLHTPNPRSNILDDEFAVTMVIYGISGLVGVAAIAIIYLIKRERFWQFDLIFKNDHDYGLSNEQTNNAQEDRTPCGSICSIFAYVMTFALIVSIGVNLITFWSESVSTTSIYPVLDNSILDSHPLNTFDVTLTFTDYPGQCNDGGVDEFTKCVSAITVLRYNFTDNDNFDWDCRQPKSPNVFAWNVNFTSPTSSSLSPSSDSPSSFSNFSSNSNNYFSTSLSLTSPSLSVLSSFTKTTAATPISSTTPSSPSSPSASPIHPLSPPRPHPPSTFPSFFPSSSLSSFIPNRTHPASSPARRSRPLKAADVHPDRALYVLDRLRRLGLGKNKLEKLRNDLLIPSGMAIRRGNGRGLDENENEYVSGNGGSRNGNMSGNGDEDGNGSRDGGDREEGKEMEREKTAKGNGINGIVKTRTKIGKRKRLGQSITQTQTLKETTPSIQTQTQTLTPFPTLSQALLILEQQTYTHIHPSTREQTPLPAPSPAPKHAQPQTTPTQTHTHTPSLLPSSSSSSSSSRPHPSYAPSAFSPLRPHVRERNVHMLNDAATDTGANIDTTDEPHNCVVRIRLKNPTKKTLPPVSDGKGMPTIYVLSTDTKASAVSIVAEVNVDTQIYSRDKSTTDKSYLSTVLYPDNNSTVFRGGWMEIVEKKLVDATEINFVMNPSHYKLEHYFKDEEYMGLTMAGVSSKPGLTTDASQYILDSGLVVRLTFERTNNYVQTVLVPRYALVSIINEVLGTFPAAVSIFSFILFWMECLCDVRLLRPWLHSPEAPSEGGTNKDDDDKKKGKDRDLNKGGGSANEEMDGNDDAQDRGGGGGELDDGGFSKEPEDSDRDLNSKSDRKSNNSKGDEEKSADASSTSTYSSRPSRKKKKKKRGTALSPLTPPSNNNSSGSHSQNKKKKKSPEKKIKNTNAPDSARSNSDVGSDSSSDSGRGKDRDRDKHRDRNGNDFPGSDTALPTHPGPPPDFWLKDEYTFTSSSEHEPGSENSRNQKGQKREQEMEQTPTLTPALTLRGGGESNIRDNRSGGESSASTRPELGVSSGSGSGTDMNRDRNGNNLNLSDSDADADATAGISSQPKQQPPPDFIVKGEYSAVSGNPVPGESS